MSANHKPPCFGKSWNGADSKCAGGIDPLYTNPKARTVNNPQGNPTIPVHRRDQCLWFAQCSHQTNHRLNSPATQRPTAPVVAPRTQAVAIPPARTVNYSVPQPPQPSPPSPPPLQVQTFQPPTTYNQTMVPPHVASYGPQVVPMPYQQPGAQMPSYLTVPEPFNPEVPGWLRFLIMLLRAGAKAIFHTGAHLADHETFTRHQPPPPPPQ